MTAATDARAGEARVVLAGTGGPSDDAARVLAARGLDPDRVDATDAGAAVGPGALALATGAPLDPASAAELAPLCLRVAEAGGTVVLLDPFERPRGGAARARAAAIAHLRASGALVVADPDVWVEAVVLIAAYGLPSGPRVAVVAPPGGWLAATATALADDPAFSTARFPSVAASADDLEPADLALVAAGALPDEAPEQVAQATVVPVVPRGELLARGGRVPLVGLRAALAAATAAGDLAERAAAGLGPAERGAADALDPDLARFTRQLDKLADRAGDHETKVLLAAWGVEVTRQAVATSASAATRLAKRAGFPVEIKPWGPDVPSEVHGCPVATGVATAAEVRRAYAQVAKDAGLPLGAPVIVRATPPSGRDVRAAITRVGPLGWSVIVETEGAPAPVAAPAPLRPIDAVALARAVAATRAGDPEPDRKALADILIRASHMAVAHEHAIEELHLGRIVVAASGETSVVADAQTVLRPSPPRPSLPR